MMYAYIVHLGNILTTKGKILPLSELKIQVYYRTGHYNDVITIRKLKQ